MAVPADRQIELADLVILRVVGIKIILSVKFAVLCDRAVCGKSDRRRVVHDLLI
jgi:hypothetical protein